MPLTLEQRADAIENAGLQTRFRGQVLKLAGYILGGDFAGFPAPLKAKRLLWAQRVVSSADAAAYLDQTSLRLLRYAMAVNDPADLASIDDDAIAGYIAAVWDTEGHILQDTV